MRLFAFVFFLGFTFNCFAYDIESYLKQPSLESKERALSLVFCPLGYQDKETFLQDIDALVQRLKKTQPFDEFMDRVGFWQINIFKDEEKALFKKTQGLPPLKARQDFLDEITGRIKANFKLIIIDASGSISCAELSSIDKLSLIILGRARYKDKDNFARGFLHELGHSLGLRDEGLNSEAALCLPGPPNCAATKGEAQAWWGDLAVENGRVGYISGCCGNKHYIRPTIASLMNNP